MATDRSFDLFSFISLISCGNSDTAVSVLANIPTMVSNCMLRLLINRCQCVGVAFPGRLFYESYKMQVLAESTEVAENPQNNFRVFSVYSARSARDNSARPMVSHPPIQLNFPTQFLLVFELCPYTISHDFQWPEKSLNCPARHKRSCVVCTTKAAQMSQTKIVFLVLPRVHLIDLAGALQVFHEARDYGADISIQYCSIDEEVLTSSELPIGQMKQFSSIEFSAGDYLFVPGAEVNFLLSAQMTSQKKLMQWVVDAHAKGAYICSVCTGAFFLGLTGLLNGKKCTTHWKRTDELKKRFPAINLIEDILFTEDDRIYTSAGVTAGVDLALFILSKMTDEDLSYKVARELVVYLRRRGNDSQQSIFMKYRSHIHSGIHKVQDYLQENIQNKLPLGQLAEVACMSSRNLTRTFKRETGVTVNEYTILLRKELLKKLLQNPDMTRKQMARHCGLKSERQVIRLLNTVG